MHDSLPIHPFIESMKRFVTSVPFHYEPTQPRKTEVHLITAGSLAALTIYLLHGAAWRAGHGLCMLFGLL